MSVMYVSMHGWKPYTHVGFGSCMYMCMCSCVYMIELRRTSMLTAKNWDFKTMYIDTLRYSYSSKVCRYL